MRLLVLLGIGIPDELQVMFEMVLVTCNSCGERHNATQHSHKDDVTAPPAKTAMVRPCVHINRNLPFDSRALHEIQARIP
jgi:hypothetical protein